MLNRYTYHVIASNVHISVADPAVLDVEGDVLVPGDVPLDLDLLELGIRACLCPSNCAVHCAHSSEDEGRGKFVVQEKKFNWGNRNLVT